VSTAISILESSTYSTNVGGKSYSANISQANGTYTLSVPNLPGASVSGSSLNDAEIALSIKINTLV
jgi:predicted RNase H-like HicB family nuclease